jgi:putative DNA primase/helicase
MTSQTQYPAAGQDRAPLPPIKFDALAKELLSRAESLLEQWLPGGVRRGHEYVCGSVHGGEGTSCSVNINTGMWADFSSGEKGGDLISLYAASNDLSSGKAAVQVARDYGLEDIAGVTRAREGDMPAEHAPKPLPEAKTSKPKTDEGWATVRPVPAMAPAPTFWHFERNSDKGKDIIGHTAEYRVGDELHGYVVRFITSTGGKDTLPHTWCVSSRDGTAQWKWKTWDDPKPLYFPSHNLPNGKTVVLVEGEKKADALQKLLDITAPDIYTVASWAGGCNGWKKADWAWLKDCAVLLWPDCDAKRVKLTRAEEKELVGDAVALQALKDKQTLLPAHKQPGMAAMLGIGAALRDTHGCTVQLLKIPEPLTVPDGWDCGDAIEADSWTGERVLAFFGTAYALPASESGVVLTLVQGGKKIDGPVDTGGSGSGGGGGDGGDGGDDDGFEDIGGKRIPSWLAWYYSRKDRKWLTSRKMVIAILEKDPILEPILAYNELSNNVQSRELWPWAYAETGDVIDAVDLLLGKYLTDTYGLPSIPRAALSEAIQTVAHSRRFHPIREYLEGLPAHDLEQGKSRLDNWLVHVLGESPKSLKPAMLEYLQIVGRCWLLGMVNRVMEPGCKFDYCPVLEGIGGLRKSTLVEALASAAFFSDTPFEVGKGKEAQEQVQGLWLYEIAEMTHFSKSEVGAIKAFITSKVDRYRVAYGTTVGSFKRQCVLVGTTNENTYLRDRTGNRRFWPVPVKHVINTEWLIKFRDALFAEAYALYKTGVAYTPTPEQERRLFEPMQESRLVETALMGELLHVLTRDPTASVSGQIVNNLTNFVTLSQLVKALETDAYKSSQVQESAVRGWLASEGWERKKMMVNKVRAWGYERPKNWPFTEIDDDMTAAPEQAPQTPTTQDDDDVPF